MLCSLDHLAPNMVRAGRMTGVEIRTWRRGRGWTREQLAVALRVSHNSIGRWERDQTQPLPSLRQALRHLMRTEGATDGAVSQD